MAQRNRRRRSHGPAQSSRAPTARARGRCARPDTAPQRTLVFEDPAVSRLLQPAFKRLHARIADVARGQPRDPAPGLFGQGIVIGGRRHVRRAHRLADRRVQARGNWTASTVNDQDVCARANPKPA